MTGNSEAHLNLPTSIFWQHSGSSLEYLAACEMCILKYNLSLVEQFKGCSASSSLAKPNQAFVCRPHRKTLRSTMSTSSCLRNGLTCREGILEYYWGEHIHLGYYSEEERRRGYKKKDFKQAKFDFIDEMLKWSGANQPQRILDVGCGIGGTSRYLAKKFPQAQVEGTPWPSYVIEAVPPDKLMYGKVVLSEGLKTAGALVLWLLWVVIVWGYAMQESFKDSSCPIAGHTA